MVHGELKHCIKLTLSNDTSFIQRRSVRTSLNRDKRDLELPVRGKLTIVVMKVYAYN
jgi:hypothetical protein